MKKWLIKISVVFVILSMGLVTVNGFFVDPSSAIVLVEEETHGSKTAKDTQDKSVPDPWELAIANDSKPEFLSLYILFKSSSFRNLPERPPESA